MTQPTIPDLAAAIRSRITREGRTHNGYLRAAEDVAALYEAADERKSDG